jgi:hypothetical protein
MCRPEAEQFGTPLHDELFRLEATYMKEEAARFLQVSMAVLLTSSSSIFTPI